jgi:hypothetical protein
MLCILGLYGTLKIVLNFNFKYLLSQFSHYYSLYELHSTFTVLTMRFCLRVLHNSNQELQRTGKTEKLLQAVNEMLTATEGQEDIEKLEQGITFQQC